MAWSSTASDGQPAFDRNLLLNGLDDVALTLDRSDRIDAYEATHPGRYDTRVVTAA